jgi:O-antigen/teichoic acid export membrane protein
LTLWTGDAVIVENTHLLVSLLVIGNALNGLMNLPYALQLAYGWTKLAFYMNTAAVIILVPSIYYSTNYWGSVGAASVWIVLNSTYLLVGVQLMHRRLIKDEKWRWYSRDVLKLLSISLIVTLSAKVMMPESFGAIETIAALIFVWGIATLAALVCAETLRKHALSWSIFRVQ